MLYNEEQKNRYMKQSNMVESSKDVFEMILKTATKVEVQENMDLSNFNRPQVVNLLKTYNAKSRQYLRLVCNHFSNYYSWCCSEGLVDITNFTNWYDVKLAKPIISEVLSNEMLTDKFFNDEYILDCVNNKVKDKQNKLLLYAPYLGIDGNDHEDLRYLKIDDLNEENKTINLISGRIANVDDLFIELIKDANKATRYDKNGTGEFGRGHTEYGVSQYVFKSCGVTEVDALISSKNMNQRFATIKDQTGNRLLSIPLVYKNGLLNYIEKYFKTQGVSLYEALLDKKETKIDYGKNETRYIYEGKVQELINEFGSKMTSRMLRHQMSDIIQYWNDLKE
jgi:hypothetical protein